MSTALLLNRALSVKAITAARLSSVGAQVLPVRLSQITVCRNMSSISSTMKAVVCDKTGGPEVLRYTEDHSVPKVGDSEVLVKNKYGGINYIDTYFRTGLYTAPSWPLVLGQEGVGTVAAVGGSNTHGLKEGDEVVWLKQGKSLSLALKLWLISHRLLC